jgi:hypothetical protein
MLAGIEKLNLSLENPIISIGRVPLYFFIIHFYLIHFGALLLFMIKTRQSFFQIDFHFSKSFGGITEEGGYNLFWVYVFWILIVMMMYPWCRWYSQYKNSNKKWWLGYL